LQEVRNRIVVEHVPHKLAELLFGHQRIDPDRRLTHELGRQSWRLV